MEQAFKKTRKAPKRIIIEGKIVQPGNKHTLNPQTPK